MTLPLQILLLVTLLVGLATIVVSAKNWHWTQLVLVMFVFFATIGYLYLAAETMAIHHKLRAKIPGLEKDLVHVTLQNKTLLQGNSDQLGILELDHQLQIVARERGRVWRGVAPVGEMNERGGIEVEIKNPQPHGLEKDAIVFAFEAGDPNNANPEQGPQYLGELRVVNVQPTGVLLEPTDLLDRRSGQRLAGSQGPWSLYETMPIDRHKLFEGLSEEELRQMLPAESVEEYVRHGTPATDDDDQWHRRGFDENDEAVGPEDIDQAVKFVYDRPLRDYAFLFSELAKHRILKLTSIQAVTQDNAKLEQSLQSAEKVAQVRLEQQQLLAADLAGMQKDRAAIEAHRDLVQRQLRHARAYFDQWLAENSALAKQLTDRQLGRLRQIDLTAPAPATTAFTGR